MPHPPRRIGGYRIVRRLGQGGMGTVYLAETPGGERVAVKVIRDERLDDEGHRRRFARETAILRRVTETAPACTARIVGSGWDDERAYLVTEYVDAPDLARRVTDGGPLAGDELLALGTGVAAALRALHEALVIHRDLKPANVLLAPSGPKVIDFGVAQLADGGTTTRAALGTAGYMSPEQALGHPVTPASDVFAWGAIMAYAATGRCPFGEDAVAAVTRRVAYEEPDLEGVDGRLRDVIAWALRKDPAARPDAERLAAALDGAPVPAPDLSWTVPDPYGPAAEGARADALPEARGSARRVTQRAAGLAAVLLGAAGVLGATGSLKALSAWLAGCGLVPLAAPYPWRSRRLGALVTVAALLAALGVSTGAVPIGARACAEAVRADAAPVELSGFDTTRAGSARESAPGRWAVAAFGGAAGDEYTWTGIRGGLPDWCAFQVDLDVTVRGPSRAPAEGMGWGYGLGVCSAFDGAQPRGLSLQYAFYQGRTRQANAFAMTRLPAPNDYLPDQPATPPGGLDQRRHHWRVLYDHGRVAYQFDYGVTQTAWYAATGYPLLAGCLGSEFLLRVWQARVEVENVLVSPG
ncbi:serine/threonine protein kinase [Nonomuraea sp. SMC257]|uniref:Serine/threonine protein kinase n=1 Tax=Nonomuraea montanisoli TaxID=2741721 RepID=A0A7Y6IA66_9ACTN|nr:serine/threonine-protein kinase [Nonomuraea montanisoli]NUW33953.1 serine/threonine protein kinase [Nonomuraea montanisoli]